VERVIRRQFSGDPEVLQAALIIAFRLRCNFVHRRKEIYRINDQMENFHNANDLLMLVYEMHQA
jgi:hypothetical protein